MTSCVERRYLNHSQLDIAHSRLPWIGERGLALPHGMGLRSFSKLYGTSDCLSSMPVSVILMISCGFKSRGTGRYVGPRIR
jgi:hypothetical protein